MTKSSDTRVNKLLGQLANPDGSVPKAIHSFENLSRAALDEGMIAKRTKHMIALAIAMAHNFTSCIDFHLQCLVKDKLQYEELLELCAIAIYMGGGPAFACASKTLNIFQQMHPVTTHALVYNEINKKQSKKSSANAVNPNF